MTRRDIAWRGIGAAALVLASTAGFCRARVPEVLVDDDRFAVVADRITPEAMRATQHLPFWMNPAASAMESFPPRRAA